MLKMSTVEARENFSELINQAAYGNERVVLTRRGKPLVAVISLKELKQLGIESYSDFKELTTPAGVDNIITTGE